MSVKFVIFAANWKDVGFPDGGVGLSNPIS